MFKGSNAVRTAELMLAHKSLAYDEVILKRGDHVVELPALGFSGTTVPALVVGGERFQGTREISRALDELQPEPRLFPANIAERRAIEVAERCGEELQDAVRRLFYYALNRHAPSAIERLAATHHGATAAAVRHDLTTLNVRLDQIDDWIHTGLLGSVQLNAADFQIAPNLAWLLHFDDIAPSVADRPAAAYATRVAGENYRRVEHAFPSEWLRSLRSTIE